MLAKMAPLRNLGQNFFEKCHHRVVAGLTNEILGRAFRGKAERRRGSLGGAYVEELKKPATPCYAAKMTGYRLAPASLLFP